MGREEWGVGMEEWVGGGVWGMPHYPAAGHSPYVGDLWGKMDRGLHKVHPYFYSYISHTFT